MDIITIKDIELSTHIGTSEKERSQPQTLYVDLTLHHTRMVVKDNISTTFDYVPLARQIYALADTTRDLIETLAQEVLFLCMADPRVEYAIVTVRKPSALKNGVPSVTLEAKR